MQTTQGQNPQYTLPVVQPQLAPPPGPNVKEGYKSYSVKCLAIAQLVLGGLAFGFQLWDTINLSLKGTIGAGLWSGAFFIATGCLGLVSANQKTTCSIVSYMVMSVLSSCMAIALLVISETNLEIYNDCAESYLPTHCKGYSDYLIRITVLLSLLLIVIAVAQMIISAVAASFACHGCCCSSRNQSVLPNPNSAAPTQYVQGPNGQLLLVTGQQPNRGTTMTGLQVSIGGNPDTYQTQTDGHAPYTTQGYTVPTMPTQQPMPQPNSVQPPAYQAVADQAVGNQQPQVHQSADDGKTYTAYPDN